METKVPQSPLGIDTPWVFGIAKSILILGVLYALIFVSRNSLVRFFHKIFHLLKVPAEAELIDDLSRLVTRTSTLIIIILLVMDFPLPTEIQVWAKGILFVILLWLVMRSVFQITDLLGRVARERVPEFEPLLIRTLKTILAMIFLIITLKHFNYDIWHILTALGIGTLAVGLAAQATLANMIAGFTILIDRPFRLGDRVGLATGEIGDVNHIGIRSTKILTLAGNLLIVSNNELVNSRVINYSLPDSGVSHKVKIILPSEIPLFELRDRVLNGIVDIPGILPESIQILATKLSNTSMEAEVDFKVDHFSTKGRVTDHIIERLSTDLKSLRLIAIES